MKSKNIFSLFREMLSFVFFLFFFLFYLYTEATVVRTEMINA